MELSPSFVVNGVSSPKDLEDKQLLPKDAGVRQIEIKQIPSSTCVWNMFHFQLVLTQTPHPVTWTVSSFGAGDGKIIRYEEAQVGDNSRASACSSLDMFLLGGVLRGILDQIPNLSIFDRKLFTCRVRDRCVFTVSDLISSLSVSCKEKNATTVLHGEN